MRPFSSLGLKPFLWADEAAQKQIQARFYELSRKLHPDRTSHLPDEEREASEAQAAALNADYAKLRDVWRLMESVLATAKPDAGAPRKSGPPPSLAMEYFELQERLEDEGPSDELRVAADELRAEVEAEVRAAEAETLEVARRFPFAGFASQGADAPVPWTSADLASLAERLDRVRFGRSFLRDFDAKFARA